MRNLLKEDSKRVNSRTEDFVDGRLLIRRGAREGRRDEYQYEVIKQWTKITLIISR